jgi:formate hydrogenlyase transcriptional activator
MASVAGSFEEVYENSQAEWDGPSIPELERKSQSRSGHDQIAGSSLGFQRVWQAVEMVAPTDATVLILGETGTGKEVCARAVHENSLRKRGLFVKINCTAIPSGLLESELFSHERGAFTGAFNQTTGKLQSADRGTLFLDEVGDLPLESCSRSRCAHFRNKNLRDSAALGLFG